MATLDIRANSPELIDNIKFSDNLSIEFDSDSFIIFEDGEELACISERDRQNMIKALEKIGELLRNRICR